ncbi:MAG: Crp/Fnr family transcriptional regulator [Lysinibacillus sp.]
MQLTEFEIYIKTNGRKMTFEKHTMIFKNGERAGMLYLLMDGWVKIAQEGKDGQAITLSLRRSGDLFGLVEILAEQSDRSRSAYSLTRSTVYALPIEKMEGLLNKHPGLMAALCKLMAQRLLESQEFIKVLTSMSVPQRLSWFLRAFAEERADGLTVEFPLTHEEVSYILGCSRQKVTSFLNLWRTEGYITYERGKIKIINQAALIFEE